MACVNHHHSLRESAFNMKDGHQLGEWVESVGLEMYRYVIETHVPSGERLVYMTRQHNSSDLLVSDGVPGSVCVECGWLECSILESLTPSTARSYSWL